MLSGRGLLTDELTRKLEEKLAVGHLISHRIKVILTTSRDLVGLGVRATIYRLVYITLLFH
jgi:hypothetical protein